MAEDTLQLLRECQLSVYKPNPRQYVASIPQLPGVEVWFQRASDVVRKLSYGDVDLGIVGYDMFAEISGAALVGGTGAQQQAMRAKASSTETWSSSTTRWALEGAIWASESRPEASSPTSTPSTSCSRCPTGPRDAAAGRHWLSKRRQGLFRSQGLY